MNEQKWQNMLQIRIALCGLALLFCFGLLLYRLWQVQVLQNREHQDRNARQSIRLLRLNPARGRIFSADGQVLADNHCYYDLGFYVSEMRQPGRSYKTTAYILACEKRIALCIGRMPQLTADQLQTHIRRHPILPLIIGKDLTAQELARVGELTPPIPGLAIIPRSERKYPVPESCAHILGFTGRRLPEDDINAEKTRYSFVTPELSGRSGLEATYNHILAGRNGSRLLKVDAQGFVHDDVRQPLLPRDGDDLHLTIDSRAQRAAETALRGKCGALVLIEVNSGAVLALASAPTYSLEELSAEKYAALDRAPGMPMKNRAVNETYTPGSIIKPLIALAALNSAVLHPQDSYNCIGYYALGNTRIRCAKLSGHGSINLQEAIYMSCNPFFLHYGSLTGLDRLQPFFTAAGLGEKTGIDVPEFWTGIRPSREGALRWQKRPWQHSDTALVSLGQGIITMTPLQAALYTAALANGGILYRPFLVQKSSNPAGKIVQTTPPVIRHRLPTSPAMLRLIQTAMQEAVRHERGTAHGLQQSGLSLAAKTGTAEIDSGGERHKNAWAICYGPCDAPSFALACVIERGESGGHTAVPVVADFLQRWQQAAAVTP
jgi:penicillin-binding protein 2